MSRMTPEPPAAVSSAPDGRNLHDRFGSVASMMHWSVNTLQRT
jgi:hypothetical protein